MSPLAKRFAIVVNPEYGNVTTAKRRAITYRLVVTHSMIRQDRHGCHRGGDRWGEPV
jgi:hypothetical protein